MPIVFLETLPPETPGLDWLGPVVTAAAGVLVALIGGASLIWRRVQDRKEVMADKLLEKEPDAAAGWSEIRLARAEASRYYRLYRLFEDLFFTVHAALRALARSIHEQHPDQDLGEEVMKALALRPPEDLDKV